MKQLLNNYICCIILLTVMLALPVSANAKSTDFQIDNGVLVKYNGSDDIVEIPKGVAKIGHYAFENSRTIKVIVPDGVTEIGEGAFQDSELEEIRLPEEIQIIGKNAFMSSELKTINLPDTIIEIGEGAFSSTNLTEIDLPKGITKINDEVFRGCDFKSIVIPDHVTNIGYRSFYMNYYLKEVTLSKNLEQIGDEAFNTCTRLKSITIPDGVKSIGDSAFEGCASLKKISIPASVERLGKRVFAYSEELKDISVSKENQFYSSDGIMLYNKDKTMLISYPSATGEVVLPEGIKKTEEDLFDEAILNKSYITKITFPSTLEQLGDNTFYECGKLEEISLPASLESFGKQEFVNCDVLNTIHIYDTKGEKNFSAEDGVLYNEDKTTLYCDLGTKDIILKDTVTAIGSYAFPNVKNSVTIPNSVISFGENIFIKTESDDDPWPYDEHKLYVYGYMDAVIAQYCKENPYGIQFLPYDCTYTINYELMGGTNHSDNPVVYTMDTEPIELKQPVKKGYVFQYWYERFYADQDGTCWDEKKISEIDRGRLGDIILYAKWEKVTVGQVKQVFVKKTSSKGFALNIQAISGAQGYQIIYANNAKFTSGKKHISINTTKKSISQLKTKTTYYIKVRAYKTDSQGNKVYGKLSKLYKVTL